MSVSQVTPIDALPSTPSRQSPDTFSDDMDAFLAAIPTFRSQANALGSATQANAELVVASATTASAAAAAAAAAAGYMGTSATNLSIGIASKAFTTEAGKSFAASGDRVTAISRGSPENRMRGSATYSGSTLTITVDEVEGSGTFSDWLLVLSALEPLPPYGKQALWIPAGAMTPRLSSGAAPGQMETSTNKVNLATLDFDASSAEYAQAAIRMPRSWNEGPITFQPVWSHGSTTTNFGVSINLRARAFGDSDALDAAFGTSQESADTGGTTDDVFTGPESAEITVAGSPQAEDLVLFEVFRNPAASGDTLAVDARLIGITVFITTDARNDA